MQVECGLPQVLQLHIHKPVPSLIPHPNLINSKAVALVIVPSSGPKTKILMRKPEAIALVLALASALHPQGKSKKCCSDKLHDDIFAHQNSKSQVCLKVYITYAFFVNSVLAIIIYLITQKAHVTNHQQGQDLAQIQSEEPCERYAANHGDT